jgi:hypoxanthine phosphoribosyltransferase
LRQQIFSASVLLLVIAAGFACKIVAAIITIKGYAMDKTVLSAQDLLEDSFRLGLQVLESGFEPTLIIAIWRGGTPVGMALQEVLDYCGVDSDHIAIRTSSYGGVDERGAVAVHGLNYIVKKICREDRVLIVDDVFDTGNTIKAVVNEIKMRARGNTPDEIRVAVPWFKPTRNETDMKPDFFLRQTTEWLVFPHELDALTPEEMLEARPRLHEIVYGAQA